jgi:hypothetical protein
MQASGGSPVDRSRAVPYDARRQKGGTAMSPRDRFALWRRPPKLRELPRRRLIAMALFWIFIFVALGLVYSAPFRSSV